MKWDDSDVFVSLKKKFKKTKVSLSGWSKNSFGDIFKQITIKKEIVTMTKELFDAGPFSLNIMML